MKWTFLFWSGGDLIFFESIEIRWANSSQNHSEIAKGFFFLYYFCLDRRPYFAVVFFLYLQRITFMSMKMSWKDSFFSFKLFNGGRFVYITDAFWSQFKRKIKNRISFENTKIFGDSFENLTNVESLIEITLFLKKDSSF